MKPSESKSRSFSATLSANVDVEYFEVDEKFVAYRMKRSTALAGEQPEKLGTIFQWLKGPDVSFVEEGVATAHSVRQFLSGKRPSIKKIEGVYAVSDAVLEAARTKGYTNISEEDWTASGVDPERPFSALKADALIKLAKFDMASHMIFDLYDNVLPVALHFDYITGGVTNENYDLDRALAVLDANPKVRHEGIKPIPYYNACEKRSRAIEFVFMPTVKDARMIWEKAQEMALRYRTEYPSTLQEQAVHELNLLKLKGAKLKVVLDNDTENDEGLGNDDEPERGRPAAKRRRP
jgi:hypothetical protein